MTALSVLGLIVRGVGRVVRVVGLLVLVLITLLLGDCALHRAGFCPVVFRRLTADEKLPIVYGYPTEELLDRARRGEIMLGGCLRGTERTACRYCTFTVDYAKRTSDDGDDEESAR